MKFGLFVPPSPIQGNFELLRNIVTTAEHAGFYSVGMGDHLLSFKPPHHEPVLECWTTFAALFRESRTLTLGPHVSCVSYRHPSLVAKMGATLDVLSGGRLELGMGAGWFKEEYDAFGIPFPEPAIRVQQLAEAVQIVKKLWTEDNANFDGKFYSIHNASIEPKPVQKPHPTLLVGTTKCGNPMLRIIARSADAWNIGNLPTPVQFKGKVDTLRRFCKDIDRDPAEIENSPDIFICVDVDRKRLREKTKGLSQNQLENGIIGTPQECVSKIKEFVDAGANYFRVYLKDVTDLQSLKLIGEEIIPEFRG